MLEFALLRRTGNGEHDLIDIGLFAETLLFYERVHIALDGGTLSHLLKTIGPELLIEVLNREGVSSSLFRESLGTITHTNNGLQTHGFAQFTVDPPSAMGGKPRRAGNAKGGKPRRASNEEWLATTVRRAIGTTLSSRRFTNKLLKRLSSGGWRLPKVGSQDLPSVMCDDMKDVASIDAAVKRVVNAFLPSFPIPNNWHFRPIDIGGSYAVDTNFDFASLNQEYHKLVPASHSSLTPAYLLTQLLDARCSLAMGFQYLGELVVDPVAATIIRYKTLEIMRKRDAHVNELDLFQEMRLPEGRKIRECLNSGERGFADFLKLLDNAGRFKQWLHGRSPEENLLNEYFKAITAESWIEKLGTKAFRWSLLGLAVEALHPTGLAFAASQGLSLFDATLLDRLLKGWRPNQFVEGKLADFVSPRGRG
jgi:hypothetical protein